MSNYNLSLTGAQVNSALNKVHNADTTPTNGSTNMITSDAVFDAVSGFVSDTSIVNNLNNPNTTTVPTTEAVSNALTMGSINVASKSGDFTFTSANGYYNSGWDLSGSDITTDGTTVGVTGAGLWLITFTIQCRDTTYNYYYENQFRLSGNVIQSCRPKDGFNYLTGGTFFNSSGYFDMNIYYFRYQNHSGGTRFRNPRVEFLKLK
jgi:hypothetical protein